MRGYKLFAPYIMPPYIPLGTKFYSILSIGYVIVNEDFTCMCIIIT